MRKHVGVSRVVKQAGGVAEALRVAFEVGRCIGFDTGRGAIEPVSDAAPLVVSDGLANAVLAIVDGVQ